MKPLGIRFPQPAEAALQNADEYRSLSANERFDCCLGLIRAVEGICRERPDRAGQRAEHDRMKAEEFEALIRTQVRGHV